MASRLRILGVIVIIMGVVAVIGSAYGYTRFAAGADALQGFSEAQAVTLTYDDEGRNTDRGTVEGADAIKALLGGTWRWPINEGELDPNDPLVDTATEYMYQMATIAHHTLQGTQSVALPARVEYDAGGDGIAAGAPTYSPATLPDGAWDPAVEGYVDAVFEPGVYTVPVNERYWTEFVRTHPLDGPARDLAWNGTVHGLFAQLGVGATTASSLEMALTLVGLVLGLGVVLIVIGGGLVWVGMARKDGAPAPA